ncbi:DUF6445 family protein [Ferrimonas balearica]|uniref:DUF6445 family protein n=1 Tax=Ferrimonas balearica TaxID=44012 RepID=UPI001C99315B|nr:DUF6445 family protein [Ferrimonas balearica]MBY5993985.1 hypothetical protein [Ferrimonas balearica]
MVTPDVMDPKRRVVTLSPHWPVQVQRVGEERTPVLVVDEATESVAPLCQVACEQARFAPAQGAFYPGVRAPLPPSYVIDVVNRAVPLIRQHYQVPPGLTLKPRGFSFSLVTTNEADLVPLQRLPHFDTPEPYYFALLHYLNPGPHGATALFRHRSTGFERVSPARSEAYFAAAQPGLDRLMTEPGRYLVQSNAEYECYHRIDYRQNRLAIYPGNLLHSIQVNPDTDIDANPGSGRLTANIFISFGPPKG